MSVLRSDQSGRSQEIKGETLELCLASVKSFQYVNPALPHNQGMAALNGGLGSSGLSNGTGSTMEALTQAYSGIQQYAAAALPTLYNQNLLTQQSIGAAGSQKEGECERTEGRYSPCSRAEGQAKARRLI